MSLLDYWGKQRPPLKRQKTADAARRKEDQGTIPVDVTSPSVLSPKPTEPPAPDEELPVDEETQSPASQTELESSLPVIDTDNQNIDEYETSRAVEDADYELDTHRRLQDGNWQKGKSSIYVDAFNLALETVLDEEAHLFDDVEMEVFRQWRELSYGAQYLYVRLFLRKTSAWHRINQLNYHPDITDLYQVVADLQRCRSLLISRETENTKPADVESGPELNGTFRFADSSELITTLEEASSLLLLEELKSFAREAKVHGKGKKELLEAFRRCSQTQTGLDWNGPKTEATNRNQHFAKKILDYTGDCIRLTPGPRALFERVHLVFYRSTEWTEKSLTTIILAKISRRNFPAYIVCRSNSIFPCRSTLLEFESGLRTQFEIDNVLQFNGTPGVKSLQRIRDLCDKVYPRWKALLEQEQRKEDTIYECGEGAYLRRFSPAWVYTRIIHKGLHPLGRFKEYKKEHQTLSELLSQRLFHLARRGAWYQRKALLEEHYMWSFTPLAGGNEEQQRKHWKRIALRTCEEGLEDPDCHLIYHYDLQKRITKLEKALKIPKREQHDFNYAILSKPAERTVEGIRIEQVNVTLRTSETKRGRPTIWLNESPDPSRNGNNAETCRVETMVLNHYKTALNYKAHHTESTILRTLFAYLFYDIFFHTPIPNVFQTSYQTCPLDLHTDAFYPSRASEINHRLAEISNGAAPEIIREVYEQESERRPCVVGLDWSLPVTDVVEIAGCFRGEALAVVCRVFAQEYAQRGGGVPDLVVWKPRASSGSGERGGRDSEGDGAGEVKFVEVKSENDRLSDAQRLWIHVLVSAGVGVELCNAVAREVIQK